MKCQKCQTNEAEMLKSGKYRKTMMDTAYKYDYTGSFLCKDCRKEFEKHKKETYQEAREKREAPLSILSEILGLDINQEWNLKLSDAEYLIKRIN